MMGKTSKAQRSIQRSRLLQSLKIWSEDPTVVSDTLSNIVDLTDQDDVHIKTVCSHAGHMMVLSALKKHADDKKVISFAIIALYNITNADHSTVDALVSAGAVDVVVKALETNKEDFDTVECDFDLLKALIGDSWERALALNNSEVLQD